MKNTYQKTKNIKIVGTLVKDGDDFAINVEHGDGCTEYNLVELLEDMVDTEISITSTLNINE